MITLTEFLAARLDDDEAVARAAMGQAGFRRSDSDGHWVMVGLDYEGEWPQPPDEGRDHAWLAEEPWHLHVNRFDPARVLAECEAKRRIVARGASECGGHEDQEQFGSHHYPDPEWSHCDGCSAAESSDRDWIWTLRVLALPYADHPDFDEAWRP